MVDETCEMLRMKLVDVAFVLEQEAKEVADKEKEQIEILEQQVYEKHCQLIDELSDSHESSITRLETRTEETSKRWR